MVLKSPTNSFVLFLSVQTLRIWHPPSVFICCSYWGCVSFMIKWSYPKAHCHYSFSHYFYQRGVTFQFDGKIIMFDLGQCISYTILSTVIVISYILYILIIWYINTKALGTITSFDKVSIDTILIRLFQLTLIYIGVNIYMFDECSMQDAKNIVLTLPNYILACLILSSEILNSSFRILFLQKQHWLDETSDTNIRRMAWVIRIIIAGR